MTTLHNLMTLYFNRVVSLMALYRKYYLITEIEVVTGKSQTEASPY